MGMHLTKPKFAVILLLIISLNEGAIAQTSTTLLINGFAKAVSSLPLQDNGAIMGMEEFNAITAAGPNALPALFERLSREEDSIVRRAITMAIKRTSLFHKFRYSIEDRPANQGYVFDSISTPLLIQPVNSKGLFVKGDDRQLMPWWNRREKLINRNRSIANFKQLTKSFRSGDFSVRDIHTYESEITLGIFNLPVVISSVGEDNSAVAFTEFLRLSHSPLYNEVCPLGQWKSCITETEKAVPTRSEKIEMIKAWWAKSGDTFTQLPKLHSAIATEVAQLSGDAVATD